MTPDERIVRIERSAQQLLSEMERLPADVLYREPIPGEWPVMSTLAHLAELLPYWAHQAASVAAMPGAAFGRTHDDPDRLGAVEQHGHDSLDATIPRIRAALSECLSTLRQIPSEGWSVVGNSPTRGVMSAADIVDRFLVEHVEEHAEQISATLKSLTTSTRN